MKVLMITNKIPFPVKDGGSFAMTAMHDGYVQEGLHVKMLCMTTYKHGYKTRFIPDNVDLIAVPVDTRIKPIKLLLNLFFSRLPYNYQRFNSEVFNQKLIALLSKEEYDIIQLEGLYLGHYLQTIRENSQARIILRAHNVEHAIWQGLVRREKNKLKKYYFNIIGKRLRTAELDIIQKVDSILSITTDDAVYFEKNTKVPVFVSPTHFGKLGASGEIKKHNALFFMGSLDWIPNQDALWWFIQYVWKKISIEQPSLQLFIAGRNCPRTFRKKIVGVPGVKFMGEVESAPSFMLSHGIFVLPLFAGSGLRIRIIEAMSLGIPIIASSLAVKGIDCSSYENIIVADNSDEFYQAVTQLLQSDNLYHKISSNARAFVHEEFNQEKIMKGTVSFIRQLV